MADQNVTIRLTAEIGAFKAAMSEASNASKSAASNIKSSWSTAGDGAASSASKTQKAWSGIDSGAVNAAGRVDKAWSTAGIGATGMAAKVRGSWNGVEVPGVSGAKLVSSAWSSSGNGATMLAGKVRQSWTGIEVPGVTGAKLVSSAWSSSGNGASMLASKVRQSWTGVEVPGVTGAKLVSSSWSASGTGAQNAARGIGTAWQSAGTQAGAAATKVAPWATAGEVGKHSAQGLGTAYQEAGNLAGAAAGKVAPWGVAGEAGKASAAGLGEQWMKTGEEAAGSANGVRSAWGGIGGFTDSLISKQREHSEAWRQVSTSAVVSGGLIVAGVGAMVKSYADFDAAMSNVKADTHETAGNLDALREAAINAGADTAYSATEAAGAIDELAKAGVSTKDILGGGLAGALSLAAAGQLNVGEAAETAASAMTQFGLKGTDLNHVADLLSAGAGKAQGSVHDMGEALNQAGLIASQSGLSIEETTGGLAAFASAGLTGSDAGTSFKTMLQRLQAPSKEAQGMLDELGITMYDQQGKFVGLANLSGQLHDKMGGLTDAQRNAAMATIFGSDAVRGANVLYEQGQGGMQGWIDKVNDAGYAAETAAAKQDNLKGDLEKLGGSMETVFLRSGSGANDALRSIVQFADGVVDKIGHIPGPVLSAGAAIAGIGGAALVAVGGGMKMITMLAEANGALAALTGFNAVAKIGGIAGALKTAATESGALRRGLSLAAGGLTAFAVGLSVISMFGKATETSAVGFDKLSANIDKSGHSIANLDQQFKNAEWAQLQGSINGVGDAVAKLGKGDGWEEANANVAKLLGYNNSWEQMKNDVSGVDQALAQMVQGGNFEGAAQNFEKITQKARDAGVSGDDLVRMFPQLSSAVDQYATSLGVTLDPSEKLDAMMGHMPQKLADAAGGADKAKDGIAGMGQAADDTAQSLSEIVKGLEALGLAHISAAEAESQFQASMAGVGKAVENINGQLGGMGQALNESGTGFNLTTEAGRAAQKAYDDVAKSGLGYAQALADANAPQQDIVNSLHQTYDGLIQSAGQFGITGQAADQLARYVMGIPENKSIDTWMSDYAKDKAGQTKGAVESIPANKSVDISATDRGSVAAVQAKVDSIHGKVPEILVTDKGTSHLTQGQIDAIRGHSTKIDVTDQGTVYHTQGAINGITDGDATILVTENGVASVQGAIDSVRGKQVFIDVMERHYKQGMSLANPSLHGGATGGQVGSIASGAAGLPLRGFARGGGLIPGARPVNRLKDNLRAMVMDTGEMIGVQSREFILNGAATDRNRQWIEWMNAGGTVPGSPGDLIGRRGFADGGSPSNGYTPPPRGFVAHGTEDVGASVSAALASWTPVVQIGGREFYGVMQKTARNYGSRS